MCNGLYFISPTRKENQNNWCSVTSLHSVVENNSFCFCSKILSRACKLDNSHLFFPTVISLSAHSILCMTEALPLPKYSQCLPLTCWPRVIPGRLLFRSQLSRLPSSCNGTCLLPCMSSWDQRNAALCAPGDATSSRGRNNETTVKLC